ncbi:hypothetical protein EI94DRAFT_1708179 [Lactarius quietus]|nr:hypothetical protein EI94DRAFT_1708179 [Lactarius quietus]
MASGHYPNSSDGESEWSPPLGIPHVGEGFSITSRDASVLRVHIEKFQHGDTDARNKILEEVAGEVYALRPPNTVFDKKEVKCKIRTWFYNHYDRPHRQLMWDAPNRGNSYILDVHVFTEPTCQSFAVRPELHCIFSTANLYFDSRHSLRQAHTLAEPPTAVGVPSVPRSSSAVSLYKKAIQGRGWVRRLPGHIDTLLAGGGFYSYTYFGGDVRSTRELLTIVLVYCLDADMGATGVFWGSGSDGGRGDGSGWG